MNPVVDQIDLLHQLAPEAKKVGLLYCTAESNSKIQIEPVSYTHLSFVWGVQLV